MIILLLLLLTKHFVIDFILQTKRQIECKGIFGHPVGFAHSFEHGIWTGAILSFYVPMQTALLIIYLETLIHYLTDFCKIRYGCQDIGNKRFWIHLGFDQFVHQLTYLVIVQLILTLNY